MDATNRSQVYNHSIYQINDGTEESDFYPMAGFGIAEDAWACFNWVTKQYDAIRFVLSLWHGEESHVG